MSKKNPEGMSKRQEFREKRRRAEQRTRFIWIGVITVLVLLVAFFLIYPQVKPVAAIVTVTPMPRPGVSRNTAGETNAPVKLVEFSDFQCPYCKQFSLQTEPQIMDTYVKTGKVQFTSRSAGNWVSGNVGGGGIESEDAAMAAYCAADQNKYWEMYDALYANNRDVEEQGSFTSERLRAIAQSVGLDMTTFNSCYSNNKYIDQVNMDFTDAQNAGITGTPFFVITYYVNGQRKDDTIDGAQPFSVFQQKLDAAFTAAGAK